MAILPPEQNYLIHLLATVLHDAPPQNPPKSLDWERLYKQSDRHGVANMAFYALRRMNSDRQPPQEVRQKFQSDYQKAMAKEATQHITVEQLLNLFEENGIPCLPLKGYLLKHLYPRPDLRMMADVDILFKAEQAKQVKRLMLEQGFSAEHQGGNHDVYYRKPYMNIEMHRRLIAENSPYSVYLNRTWDRAHLKPGFKFIWQLSPEDFYIYLLIHLTKHYTSAGTGIRSFMDIWVYRRRYKAELNWDYIQTELEEINLREFAESICGLGEMWFGTGQSNELYEEMTGYIVSSGAYGTRKQSVISSLGIKSEKKNLPTKQVYWLRLFFPPLETLKNSYPVLDTQPFLLPACWVLRGVKCLLFKRRHMLEAINHVHSVSEQDIAGMENLHKRAGLLK